ncbi:putative enzyme related to lactoylglutathione lyase [Deinococcus metalli]|uniref:Glyoxalase n=1 Tax=Deinococcus metalli TaxID=1141878 RepID=A0A7W8KI83_9DEIO|nr:VOC family protein [Deinococcus metalli]MBB5378360.1 putative enzyme related to lactoylglutathione lyase [Deinococcus metalli]GHF59462.1 glyoxalase [Deinococcus metalli]
MHTTLDFIALHTTDLDAARRYYTGVLGFETTPGPPNAAVFIQAGGAALAIREPLPHERTKHFGAGVSVWFGVPDADAYHARIAAAGAQVIQPPQDGPFGRMFSVRTPDGHALTFHQTPA